MQAQPRSKRRLWIALIVLLGLLGAGLLAGVALLDVGLIRPAAEARLATALGQPVSIGDLRVSMFPVPSLVGSTIHIGSDPDAPDLALQRVRIIPRLRSLFQRPYVIREVTLEGLTVRVVREPLGRWRFPAVIPVAGSDSAGQVVIERMRLTGGRVRVWQLTPQGGLNETSSIDSIEGEAVPYADGFRISPLRGQVGSAEIFGDATLDARMAQLGFSMASIKDSDLPATLGLAGADPPASLRLVKPAIASMSIQIDRQTWRLAGKGSLRAPEMVVDNVRLDGIEAPIRTDGVHLIFEPAVFTMYGGSHRGKVDIDLSKVPARWSLNSAVANVNVGDFLRDFTAREQRIDGSASVNAALRGTIGVPIPRGVAGRMQLTMVNGIVRDFPLLSAINRALRLAEGEGQDTRFERLTATLVFTGLPEGSAADAAGPGYVTTDDLVMQAREVRVQAAGRIGFDRSLDLAGVAVLSPERSGSAIRSVRELSGLRNDRGELELPLTIRGSLDSPAFNIDYATALRRSVEDELRRRLKRLFRR